MNKNLVIGLLAGVVIVVSGIYLFLSSTSPITQQVPTSIEMQKYAAAFDKSLPTNWKIYTSAADGFSFRYPEKLIDYIAGQPVYKTTTNIFGTSSTLQNPETTTNIQTQAWPPTVKVTTGTFTCNPTAETADPAKGKVRKTATDPVFCVESNGDINMGRDYENYSYTTSYDGKLITFSFTLVYMDCDIMPDEPQKTACEQEQKSFDVDKLVSQIFSTFRFTK